MPSDLAEIPCWADQLTSTERAKLARMLASARRMFAEAESYVVLARRFGGDGHADPGMLLLRASSDMADLHLDVTERAATPPDLVAIRERGYQQKRQALR